MKGLFTLEMKGPRLGQKLGRKKRKKYPSVGETQHKDQCSWCSDHSHNRAACKNLMALSKRNERPSSSSASKKD